MPAWEHQVITALLQAAIFGWLARQAMAQAHQLLAPMAFMTIVY